MPGWAARGRAKALLMTQVLPGQLSTCPGCHSEVLIVLEVDHGTATCSWAPPSPAAAVPSAGSPGCAPRPRRHQQGALAVPPVPSQQAALAVTPPAPSSAGSPGCAAHPIVVGREPWLCRPLCRWRQGGLAVPPVPYALVALPSEAHACGLEPSANTWSWGHRNARPCGSLHGQPLGAGVGKSHFPGA